MPIGNPGGYAKRGASFMKSMLSKGATPSAPPVPSGLAARSITPSYGAGSNVGSINPQSYMAGVSNAMGGIDPRRYQAAMPGMPGPRSLPQRPSIDMPTSPGPLPSSSPRAMHSAIRSPVASVNVGMGTRGPSAIRQRATPPRLSTPQPGGLAYQGRAMDSNQSFSGQYGGMMMAAGGMALAGGAANYMTGGSFTGGAIAGVAAGGGMYGGGKFLAKRLGQAGAGGYGSKVAGFVSGMENSSYRRAAIGSGAALGGMMFGGSRSHRRGFNSQRGNSIGR